MSIYPGVIESVVCVDGQDIAVYDAPHPGEERTPIILVHGSGGSAEKHFGLLFPMLAARRRVIAFDYGAGEQQESLTLDHLVNTVQHVAGHCVPGEAFDLAGYSLGAVIATAYAAAHPDRVSCLVSIAGWLATDSQQLLRIQLFQRLLRSAPEELGMFQVLTTFGSGFLATKSSAEVGRMAAHAEPGPDRARQMHLNESIDIRQEAARVTAPTLVIGCTDDQIVPVRQSRALFGALETARFAEVGSGHAVLTERPAQVFQLIDSFTQDPGSFPPGSRLPILSI